MYGEFLHFLRQMRGFSDKVLQLSSVIVKYELKSAILKSNPVSVNQDRSDNL